MDRIIEKAENLLEALPYIQKFRNSLVVIKFGGSAMEDIALTRKIMKDIVLLECIGMRPVVVHGGGKAISARLKELKIDTKFVNGLRHTCEETIKVVDDVLHNNVNINLLRGGRDVGGKLEQLSGKEIIRATKMFSQCPESDRPLDIGFVGEVTDVDAGRIYELLDSGIIPVIPPLGRGDDGATYNINADIAACMIAESLQARKLIFLSDVPGLLRDPEDEDSVIRSIGVSEVQKLIDRKIISGGMIPKIKSCVHALNCGTDKVHMIDGRIPHALLLEIFTDDGIGTEIVH